MGARGQEPRTWGSCGLYPAMAGEMKEEKEMRWERKTEWQSRAEDGVAMETEEGRNGGRGRQDGEGRGLYGGGAGSRQLDEEEGKPGEVPPSRWAGKGGEM